MEQSRVATVGTERHRERRTVQRRNAGRISLDGPACGELCWPTPRRRLGRQKARVQQKQADDGTVPHSSLRVIQGLEKYSCPKTRKPVNWVTGLSNLIAISLTCLGSRMAYRLGLPIVLLRCVMANVGATHPEDNILGNVRRVIGNSLQISSNEQSIERLTRDFRSFIHCFHKHDEGFIAHAVNDVIHFKDGLCELCL